jgi:hypothetical protein
MSETARLTYGELAKARGITLAAARRLALRHKWRKQLGNDGLTHVWVPVSALPSDVPPDGTDDAPASEPALDEALLAAIAKVTTGAVSDVVSGAMSDLRSDMKSVVPALQEAIISLRAELYAQRDRAEHAERRVQELEAQLVARRSWWHWGRRR